MPVNIINFLRTHGFYCSNFKPTRQLACLDNIITNFNKYEYNVDVIDVGISDHSAIIMNALDMSSEIPMSRTKTVIKRPITPNGIYLLNSCLAEFNWEYLINNNIIVNESFFDMFFVNLMNIFARDVVLIKQIIYFALTMSY